VSEALRAVYAPSTEAAEPRVTTLSLVAPCVPVLAVLAVTSVELLLGRRLGGLDWIMVFALALLVLGRQMQNLWERGALKRLGDDDEYDEVVPGDGIRRRPRASVPPLEMPHLDLYLLPNGDLFKADAGNMGARPCRRHVGLRHLPH
jgi:hypothetical protein